MDAVHTCTKIGLHLVQEPGYRKGRLMGGDAWEGCFGLQITDSLRLKGSDGDC